jgi:hypothetical protein
VTVAASGSGRKEKLQQQVSPDHRQFHEAGACCHETANVHHHDGAFSSANHQFIKTRVTHRIWPELAYVQLIFFLKDFTLTRYFRLEKSMSHSSSRLMMIEWRKEDGHSANRTKPVH